MVEVSCFVFRSEFEKLIGSVVAAVGEFIISFNGLALQLGLERAGGNFKGY